MEREWGYGARDRMRERKNFISVFPSLCCKTLKFLTFCHKTLKYVTFCREMLKYGTFCRECRKNRNIRAMRKWFWIKSGCEEAPQVVPAWQQHAHFAQPVKVSDAISDGLINWWNETLKPKLWGGKYSWTGVLRTGSVGHLSKSPTPISKFSSKLGKIGPKKMFWGVVLPPVTSFSPGASFSQWTSQ